MSIYAMYWILKFPRDGDFHSGSGWVEVIGQGVPAHIGTPTPGHGYESGDPYAAFLPPGVAVPEGEEMTALRAMVVIRDGTEKVSQEYVRPLLVLSGKEYAETSFRDLHERICDALRGGRPRWIGEFTDGTGCTRIMFEDGSVREVDPEDDEHAG